jgi:Na+-transporting NADH:ubiquinone oxidoreductase subunit B
MFPILSNPRYQRLFSLRLLALVPVLLAALFNTGQQYLAGLARAPEPVVEGWRAWLAAGPAIRGETPGLFDLAVAGAVHLLPLLIASLLTGLFWERIFAERRKRLLEAGFIPAAILFTLLLPAATPIAHAVFAMSLAMLLGQCIFGGEGKTFLSPALLGAAMLQVSFPGVADSSPLWQGLAGYGGSEAVALYQRGGVDALAAAGIDIGSSLLGAVPGSMGTTSILAVALAALLLLATRVIAWRLLLAHLLGVVFAATAFNLFAVEGAAAMPAYWHLLCGSLAFGIVFLACDPVASCCTNPGRWIQGLFAGALIVLIRVANPAHPDAVIPALLLASILAPLIDHGVIAWNIRARARRHV